MGAKVSEITLTPEFNDIAESFRIISAVEAARALAHEAREHADKLNFWIRDGLATAQQCDPASYERAQWHAIKCQRALGSFGRLMSCSRQACRARPRRTSFRSRTPSSTGHGR
jgi:hypothetical protein